MGYVSRSYRWCPRWMLSRTRALRKHARKLERITLSDNWRCTACGLGAVDSWRLMCPRCGMNRPGPLNAEGDESSLALAFGHPMHLADAICVAVSARAGQSVVSKSLSIPYSRVDPHAADFPMLVDMLRAALIRDALADAMRFEWGRMELACELSLGSRDEPE